MLLHTRVGGFKTAGGAPAFLPTSISGLQFWYDAQDSAVTEVDGLVSQLNDLSGNAAHATQSTAGARPVKVAAQFGSRAGIDFTDDRMVCGSVTLADAGTYFAAAIVDTDHLGCIVGRGANNDATAGVNLRAINSSRVISLQIGNATTRVSVSSVGAMSNGALVRVVARWNSTNLRLNVNGTAYELLSHGLATPYGTNAIMIGAILSSSSSPFDGKIGTVGKYSLALGDTDTADLVAWLAATYP